MIELHGRYIDPDMALTKPAVGQLLQTTREVACRTTQFARRVADRTTVLKAPVLTLNVPATETVNPPSSDRGCIFTDISEVQPHGVLRPVRACAAFELSSQDPALPRAAQLYAEMTGAVTCRLPLRLPAASPGSGSQRFSLPPDEW